MNSEQRFEVFGDQAAKIARRTLAADTMETGGLLAGALTAHGRTPVVYYATTSSHSTQSSVHWRPDAAEVQRHRAELYQRRMTMIGAWHSHHRLGLELPSAGDDRTAFGVLQETGWDQFYSVITTIGDGGQVGLRAFLYEPGQRRREVGVNLVPEPSPVSLDSTALVSGPVALEAYRQLVFRASLCDLIGPFACWRWGWRRG